MPKDAENSLMNLMPTAMDDSFLYDNLFEYFFSIYGDDGRARAAADRAMKSYSADPSAYATLNQTGSINKLREILNQDVSGANPYLNESRSLAIGDIRKGTQRGAEQIKQNLAQSGLRGGVGVNAYNDLYEAEQTATAKTNAQYGLMNQQVRSDAIAKLLGLENMNINALLADRDYRQQLRQGAIQNRINSSANKDNSKINWGGLAGAGLGILADIVAPGSGAVVGAVGSQIGSEVVDPYGNQA